jgi:hypothetical protein
MSVSPYKYLNDDRTYNLERIYSEIKKENINDNFKLENLIFLPQELITSLLFCRKNQCYFHNNEVEDVKKIIDDNIKDINKDERKIWYEYLCLPHWYAETYWRILIKTLIVNDVKSLFKLKQQQYLVITGTDTGGGALDERVVVGKLGLNSTEWETKIRSIPVEQVYNIVESIDEQYPILYEVKLKSDSERKTIQHIVNRTNPRDNTKSLLLILSFITFQILRNKKKFQISKWIDYGEIYRIYFREKVNGNTQFLEEFKTNLRQNVTTFIENERSDFNSFAEFVNCIKGYI